MDYFVNTGSLGNLFAIPNSVVDDYIKLASGQALKVLLYVLRNSNTNVSKDEIASALNIEKEVVDDAFNFWESVGILEPGTAQKPDVSKTIPISVQPEIKKNDVPRSRIQNKKHFATDTSSERFNLRPTEITERIHSSEQIRNLFRMAEASLGRMLNNTDQRSLIWIYEYLGMSVDVISTLVQYCVSIGKNNIVYIEKMAFEWQERNVVTLNDAENEIHRHQSLNVYENRILSSVGINTKPSKNQHEMISEWYDKGFSIELVECSYDRTMDSIGKASFPYMNSILESWNEKGISNLMEIKNFEKNNPPPRKTYNKNIQKNAPKENKKRSYDIDEFEKFAINYEELKKVGE